MTFFAIYVLLCGFKRASRPPRVKSRDLGRALHQMPRVVGHLHFDEHIPGKELSLGNRFLAGLHFNDFLNRHENLSELIRELRSLDSFRERSLHAFLESRIGVHDVPLLAHPSVRPVSSLTIHANPESTANKNKAITTTNANTIAV